MSVDTSALAAARSSDETIAAAVAAMQAADAGEAETIPAAPAEGAQPAQPAAPAAPAVEAPTAPPASPDMSAAEYAQRLFAYDRELRESRQREARLQEALERGRPAPEQLREQARADPLGFVTQAGLRLEDVLDALASQPSAGAQAAGAAETLRGQTAQQQPDVLQAIARVQQEVAADRERRALEREHDRLAMTLGYAPAERWPMVRTNLQRGAINDAIAVAAQIYQHTQRPPQPHEVFDVLDRHYREVELARVRELAGVPTFRAEAAGLFGAAAPTAPALTPASPAAPAGAPLGGSNGAGAAKPRDQWTDDERYAAAIAAMQEGD